MKANPLFEALAKDLDVKAGDQFWFTAKEQVSIGQLRGLSVHGQLQFVAEEVEGFTPRAFTVPVVLFKQMRTDGRAVRIANQLRSKRTVADIGDLPPTTLLDPMEKGITIEEQQERLKSFARFKRARVLRFYVLEADRLGGISRGRAGAEKFIGKLRSEAARAGHEWEPSGDTLIRALEACGTFQSRPLSAFFYDYQAHDKTKRWDKVVIEAMEAAQAQFWHKDLLSLQEVRNEFFGQINDEIVRLKALGVAVPPSLKKPSKETFRLWLYAAEDWWSYAARFGEDAANARFLGHGRHIKASRILEYVIFDHTVLDCWAIVEDENGDPVFVERPTLTVAIDVHSRMILAVYLSFEKPSIHNVMACLKQVVRVKDDLEEDFPSSKGAADGWGKPLCIIVDNAWEFIGISFQATCEAAGIDVVWAPVHTPQFKSIVERAIGTLNTIIWHNLPGASILTPQLRTKLGLEPHVEAVHSIRSLYRVAWYAIVNVYHLEPHEGIGRAPALAWTRSKEQHGRRTVDDVRVFDGLLGQGERCRLTTKGINLDGQHFHDPDITTALLGRLAKHGMKSGAFNKNLFKSKNAEVYATKDSVDCSYIMVWDPSIGESVRLPNNRGEFTLGLSWRMAKRIKEYAQAENLAFHSEDDQIFARRELTRLMRAGGLADTFRERRKDAADLDVSPTLNPGDTVQRIKIPTITDDRHGVAADTAARHRDDNRVPPKGPDRGKNRKRKAASKKAAPTKRRRQGQGPPVGPTTPDPFPDLRRDLVGVAETDADALMRMLEQED